MAATTEDKLEPKICEACGEPFGCGARTDGCWCAAVEVSPERLAALTTDYRDCLCPRCLLARSGSSAKAKDV